MQVTRSSRRLIPARVAIVLFAVALATGACGGSASVTGRTIARDGTTTTRVASPSTRSPPPTTVRPPQPPEGAGVFGLVTAGPTCPVERIGVPCPARPVVADIVARTASGQTAAAIRSDAAGRYALPVAPGTYQLVVVTGGMFPRCPTLTVTVASAGATRVDIGCDTGIR
jgi:hypothetical protein